jgi:hypothetical protein
MATSFNVRIWKVEVRRGARATSYRVVWKVAGERFKESFKTAALADSFRSSLVSAARAGEGFDTTTGRPGSWETSDRDVPWYEFACKYVDMKWPDAAATTRRGIAEALVTATCAMLSSSKGKPDDKEIRSALFNWAFNTAHRSRADIPDKVRETLQWTERNTRSVSELTEPEVLRVLVLLGSTPRRGRQPPQSQHHTASASLERRHEAMGGR